MSLESRQFSDQFYFVYIAQKSVTIFFQFTSRLSIRDSVPFVIMKAQKHSKVFCFLLIDQLEIESDGLKTSYA